MERPFNGAAAYFCDRIFPKGEPGELTPVQVETLEDVAQLFADELEEPHLKPYVMRFVTELQRVDGVEGVVLAAFYGRHLSVRVIGDLNEGIVSGTGDKFDAVEEDWYSDHPNSDVNASLSFYKATLKGSPSIISELQEGIRREVGVSSLAFITKSS